MHVVWVPFGRLHKCFNIFLYYSFILINIWWYHSMSLTKFKHLFSTLVALVSASYNACFWKATSCSNLKHFAWHVANFSHNASHSNVTSQSCTCITPITLHNDSRACSTMSTCLMDNNMLVLRVFSIPFNLTCSFIFSNYGLLKLLTSMVFFLQI